MNGLLWHIKTVPKDSNLLIDRTRRVRVATTDPRTQTIYLSNDISGDFKRKVLIHELGHAAMVSYNLLSEIHALVPQRYWIIMEEWICNFIADYGLEVYKIAYHVLGDDTLDYIPYELERMIL